MARSKADAVEKLDEVANAEGCPMVELSEAQVHFALTDDGQLVSRDWATTPNRTSSSSTTRYWAKR